MDLSTTAASDRSDSEPCAAIIVAAGSSSRMSGVDKLWLRLGHQPVIEHSVAIFLSMPEITTVVVVVSDNTRTQIRLVGDRLLWDRVTLVTGGASRADSVFLGLSATNGAQIVLIHDGARPLVSAKLCRSAIAQMDQFEASIPVLSISDTVKRINDDGVIVETVDRLSLRTVQTPQVFKHDVLLSAYKQVGDARAGFTDDAGLVESVGVTVSTFPGDQKNIKITTPSDLSLLSYFYGVTQDNA